MSHIGRLLGWVYFIAAAALGLAHASLWTLLPVALLGLFLDYDDPHYRQKYLIDLLRERRHWLLVKLNLGLYCGQLLIVGAIYGIGWLIARAF